MTHPVGGEQEATFHPKAGAAVAVFAFLLGIAFLPVGYTPSWSARAALVLVATPPGLFLLVNLARRRDVAAASALVFVALSAVATAFSDAPLLALLGPYGQGAGFLFLLGIVAIWAIGRHAPAKDESIHVALVAVVAVNVAVAALARLLDLSAFGVDIVAGRPTGLLGNPVHLGALGAAAFALGGATLRSERAVRALGPAAVVVGMTAVQASGSRVALVVTGATVAALLVMRAPLPRVGVVVVLAAVGLALGTALQGGEATSSTARAAESIGGAGWDARIAAWEMGAAAVTERPLLGWGPGRFQSATTEFRSVSFARAEGPDTYYTDAHNLAVELAVTTGLLGFAAAALWGLASGGSVRGPLAWFGIAALACVLAQPLSIPTIGLAVLALGVAHRPADTRARAPWAVLPLAALGVVPGFVLLGGDKALADAALDGSLRAAMRAEDVLPSWPQPADRIARVLTFRSIAEHPDDEELFAQAISWRSEAVQRDRRDARWWIALAELELKAGRRQSAELHLERALDLNPVSAVARLGLADIADAEGRHDRAARLRAEAAALRR